MIKNGFDADSSGRAVSAIRRWQDSNIVAGYLLYSYGTVPPDLSVCPDSREHCLTLAESLIQETLTVLAGDEGHSDPKYVAARITNALQQCNRRIYDLATYLGQGLAIGGAVILLLDDNCLATVFGGARMYFWDGTQLYPQGDIPPADGLIADALGTRPTWKNKYWYGKLVPGQRFICTSGILPDIAQAAACITESGGTDSHEHTVAMLLRKELEVQTRMPTAVLEAVCEEAPGNHIDNPEKSDAASAEENIAEIQQGG